MCSVNFDLHWVHAICRYTNGMMQSSTESFLHHTKLPAFFSGNQYVVCYGCVMIGIIAWLDSCAWVCRISAAQNPPYSWSSRQTQDIQPQHIIHQPEGGNELTFLTHRLQLLATLLHVMQRARPYKLSWIAQNLGVNNKPTKILTLEKFPLPVPF